MLKRSVSIKDTLAQRYIEEHRRIEAEYVPASLHFLPHAYNHTADGFFPAMIAPINSVDAEVIAAHVTFLDPKTGNKLKGDGIKSRLIFGSCRGGAIRLSGATDRLALCEGIEDGLTILSTTDWPVWVTGGTSNLRSVELPDSIREVLIGADNDQAGLEATQHLAKRLTKEGRMVRIATPPSGYKDFNAMLCGEKHHVA
ncbi:MAG: hypothetical protein EB060_01720 [Proteobacteria bacterium]|nr:hypothetical protein [Pseudomonadota bacterium]